MPDQSDDVAHAVSGPAPAPDNRPAGGAITAAGTGTGRSEGFLKPVYYARSRESYRPPPDLYRRLNHWLGPAVTSSGLSPRDVITLEVPGRRSGVVRRTLMVRIACDGEHYVVSLAGESQWVRNVRAASGRVVLGRRERRAARLVEVPPGQWLGRPAFTSASARRRRCGKSRMSQSTIPCSGSSMPATRAPARNRSPRACTAWKRGEGSPGPTSTSCDPGLPGC